jgi:hypothetical protein
MKHEIIYTEHYALIVSDEQSKENDWGYIPFQGGEVKLVGKYFADDWRKVIAHRPLIDAPILEGVPLLPEFSDEEDVEKIADVLKVGSTYRDYEHLVKRGIIIGYNKAKETYKYTEKDLAEAYERGMNNIDSDGCHIDQPADDFTEFIQSLQQPKRPKYFEYEMARITKFNGKPDYFEPNSKPNSQGQTELVGEYSYE